jgi:hypothetical protein
VKYRHVEIVQWCPVKALADKAGAVTVADVASTEINTRRIMTFFMLFLLVPLGMRRRLWLLLSRSA